MTKYWLDTILNIVSRITRISIDKIKSKDRSREACTARFIYCGIAINKLFPFYDIAKNINRDYATIHYANHQVKNLYTYDNKFKELYDEVEEELYAWEYGLITERKEVLYNPKTGEFGNGVKALLIIRYNEKEG